MLKEFREVAMRGNVVDASAVFIFVCAVNRLRRKQEEQPKEAPKPAEDVVLLREMRDLLAGARR